MRETNIRHKLAVLAFLLLLLPTSTHAERRTALVIGNVAYEVGLLRNPVHDASDMATTLRQLGFEVTLRHDAARRPMVEAIDLFSRQLRQGGVGVFYFAGHGVQIGGENYLIPVDARIGREQDVPYEAVPVGRILGGLEDADNQLNILILDACRDNPFARQWRSGQRGLAAIQAVRGSLIAYATAPGAIASDGDGRNGLYTSYLLQHLTTPGLSVEQVFKKVREGVVKVTKGRQTPWESSSLIGDFAFVPQVVSNAEAVIWARVEQSSNPEDVAAFLQAYPNGQFAPAARLKFQQLQQLAAEQRLEEQNRLAEQERQRREREAAEAQQREQERKREEETRQREERASQTKQGPSVSPPAQVARLEPESKLRERASVAVPGAILRGRQGLPDEWTQQVRAFRMDAQAVSNREFLDFVKTHTQWKKSHLSKSFHDGDYLKHWQGDETVQPEDMDRPVRYSSYFAAEAYCKARRKEIPGLNHYRAAATDTGIGDVRMSISYDAPYTAPQFNFLHVAWTNTWWGGGPDLGKRIRYQSGAIHNKKDTLEADKEYTGRSLGFRCVEY
jgi:hypothetical protein